MKNISFVVETNPLKGNLHVEPIAAAERNPPLDSSESVWPLPFPYPCSALCRPVFLETAAHSSPDRKKRVLAH